MSLTPIAPDRGGTGNHSSNYLLNSTAHTGRGGQGGATADQLQAARVGGGQGNRGVNAYAHQENNIVVSSDDLGKLNMQFQPNILDNYDVVTYHFKLFIVPPAVTSSGYVLNVQDQVIIAESGVSDLTIDKVELRFNATPSVESGTGVLTNVKFEIVEPSGAGLIDKLFYESVALGIGNWHVMPVYLQLEFKGRTPGDSNSEDGSPGAIGNLKWLWVLKLSDIKANVTTVGTRYDFTAILYDQVTQSNVYSVLRYNAVLSNLDTFGNAMQQLEDKFNADQLLMLIDNSSIPDIYKIIVDPKIASELITPVNKNQNSRRADDFVTFGEKSATFVPGTSVDKIIDSLLATTDKYQKSMTGAEVAGAEGQPMNAEIDQMKKFWRIVTEARPLQFDPRRCNNANEFTIYVIEYDIGCLDQSAAQTANGPTTIDAQRRRLATYAKKAILKKKYNYMFTGLNDQVINFDLNLNCAFAAANSRLGGVYNNLAMADKGVVTQDNSNDEAAITEQIVKAISFQNHADTANTASATTAMADAKKSIAASKLPAAQKQRYTTLLDQAKPENRLVYLRNVTAAGGINNDGTLATARAKATNLALPVDNFQGTFISDVNSNSQLAKDTYQDFLNNTRGKLHPIAFYETIQDKAIGLGIESNSNSGIQKLSSMFSTALHSGLDATLQKVKLTIKGDPFWLFPQPFADNKHQLYNSMQPVDVALDNIKNGQFNVESSVNIYGSDNFIIIRFRTPRIFNTDANTEDGSSAYNEVETFSGVYKVVIIVSKFEMGKFTHELECNIDTEIRLLDFMKDIEDNAKIADIPTTASDLSTKRNLIPDTAIKTQKIMGSADAPPNIMSSAGDVLLAKSNIPSGISNALPGLPTSFG